MKSQGRSPRRRRGIRRSGGIQTVPSISPRVRARSAYAAALRASTSKLFLLNVPVVAVFDQGKSEGSNVTTTAMTLKDDDNGEDENDDNNDDNGGG